MGMRKGGALLGVSRGTWRHRYGQPEHEGGIQFLVVSKGMGRSKMLTRRPFTIRGVYVGSVGDIGGDDTIAGAKKSAWFRKLEWSQKRRL